MIRRLGITCLQEVSHDNVALHLPISRFVMEAMWLLNADTGITWCLAGTMARQKLCLSSGQGLKDKRPCDVCMLLERHAQSFSCWRPYEREPAPAMKRSMPQASSLSEHLPVCCPLICDAD